MEDCDVAFNVAFPIDARAARMLCHVDAQLTALEAVHEYTEQQEYDKMMPALRDALGETSRQS